MCFKWNSLEFSLPATSMKDDYSTSLIHILSNKRSLIDSYKFLLLIPVLYSNTIIMAGAVFLPNNLADEQLHEKK